MSVVEITSPQNETYKMWLSLLGSKGIKEHRLFFVFGEKVVSETLNRHSDKCVQIILPLELSSVPTPLNKRRWQDFLQPDSGLKIAYLSKSLFKELDIFDTGSPLLICRTPHLEIWDQSSQAKGLELIAPLSEPSNLGALLRSAAAFGASKVVLTLESANPFLPKCVRAASGAIFSVPLFKGPAVSELNEKSLFALDSSGTPIEDFNWPKDIRLLVGNEGPGLPPQFRDQKNTLKISMESTSESLNAVIAASIALHHWYLHKGP